MPLSEREQKILDEIERNLFEEDPRFARQVKGSRFDDANKARLGVFVFAAGFAALIAFLLTRSVVIGALSFGAMVCGIVLAVGALQGLFSRTERPSASQRMATAFARWERSVRERYKKR